MNIIKRGKPPAEVRWRGNCTHCRSIMECDEKELRVTYDGDCREPGKVGRATCPVCQADVVFYPKDE